MLQGVAKWVPVYMTGMIDPYYYPKLRDGVCQRTLFIAPKTAAIVSSSVVRNTQDMLSELITDKGAVAALAKEYENFFALCRPLMRIMTAQSASELWSVWESLANADGDLICMTEAPTLATMPEQVAKAMQERAPNSRLTELRSRRAATLERLVGHHHYTEIPPEEDFSSDGIALPCADFLGAPGLRYTPEELALHMEHAAALSQRYSGYEITKAKNVSPDMLLYCKEERGVGLVKTDAPGVAFTIS